MSVWTPCPGWGVVLPGNWPHSVVLCFMPGLRSTARRFAALPPMVTAAGTMIWASVVLVPLACILDRPWMLNPSTPAIAATAVLGLFCTGVALILYFRLVRTLGSMGVASQAYLRAAVGVVLGMVILGEQVVLSTGLGVLAAMVGVALINLPVRAGAKHTSPDRQA